MAQSYHPLVSDQSQNILAYTTPPQHDQAIPMIAPQHPSTTRTYLCARLVRASKEENEPLDTSMSSESGSTRRQRVKVRVRSTARQTKELVKIPLEGMSVDGTDISLSEAPNTSAHPVEVNSGQSNTPGTCHIYPAPYTYTLSPN